MSRLYPVRSGQSTQPGVGFIQSAKLLSAVACLGMQLPVFAQTPISLESVTIEGEAIQDATPWQSQTTRKDLDALQILNWSDLGRRAEPGISFNQSNQSINLRGLDKNRVLTRIDGIRQTWLNDAARGVRGGLSTVDFNALSTIDIVRGADSSRVGSGALGGVVDVKTLSPSDLLTEGRGFGALLKGGYNSVDRSWLTSAAIASQIAPNTQVLLQAGVQTGHEQSNMGKLDGYGLSRTQPDPDNYVQQNYQLKLLQKIEGGHTLGLSGTFFNRQDNIQNLSALPQTYINDSTEFGNTSRRESLALDYGWKAAHSNSLIDTLDAQIYWQKVKLSNNFEGMRRVTPVGNFTRNNVLSDSTTGINFSVSKAIAGDVSQLWKAGVDAYANITEQSSTGQDSCPANFSRYSPCRFLRTNQADMPQVRGTEFGFWAQNTLGFANNKFSLTPGIRFDTFKQRPQESDSFKSNKAVGRGQPVLPADSSGSAISPKLLAEWAPDKQLRFFAQYAFGFNAPTPTQLYSRYGAPGTYLIAGNPDLKPETSRGWEIGTKLGDDKLNGSLTYFDNNYKNFIESVNGRGTAMYPYYVQTFENLDQVRIYGIEAKASWVFAKGWRTFGSLAWSVGQNQQTNQSLNSIVPLTAIAGLAYSQEQWGIQAQVTATAAKNNVAYPETNAQVKYADFKAPGFGIADLSLYWTPQQVKGLKLQAGIYNIFNQTYWNSSSVPTAGAVAIPRGLDLYTSPGRNVQLTMSYQY